MGTNLQAPVPERKPSRVRGVARNVRTLHGGETEEVGFSFGEAQQILQKCEQSSYKI